MTERDRKERKAGQKGKTDRMYKEGKERER